MTSLFAYLASLLIAFATAVALYPLWKIPVITAPGLGHRGMKRRLVLRKGLFRLVEPAMRIVASWISHPRLSAYGQRIDLQLVQAGDFLGITADEFIALSILSALFFALVGAFFSWLLESGFAFMVVGLLLGAALPYLQLQTDIHRRCKEVNRTLPAAIDLAALCMSAGLDFPGSLKLIVSDSGPEPGAVEEEFFRILQELEIGHTRKQALLSFERRVPTDAVRDFVGAVTQAEEKGNPLAEVLRVQAKVLRMRRSVAAEEAAARAGVMMIAPLFLLLCCILLTIMGPFIINGVGF